MLAAMHPFVVEKIGVGQFFALGLQVSNCTLNVMMNMTRPFSTEPVRKAIKNSICHGLNQHNNPVGFL